MAKIKPQSGWSVLYSVTVKSTKEAVSDSKLKTFGVVFFFYMRGKWKAIKCDSQHHDTSWPFLAFSPSAFHKPSIFITSSPSFSVCLCSTHMVTEYMGIRNESFMKMAAVGTWMGDFVTAWMVRWFSTTALLFCHNLYLSSRHKHHIKCQITENIAAAVKTNITNIPMLL